MHPLSVFISSTCFDLKSLREHLRSEVTSWGHDPILSEYSSFPVSPDLSTVENCKRVVKTRADVLVLIIGGKRGSLDPKSTNSVVNSEYREARAKGIDCLVFAEKAVWDLLPFYQKNPTADFLPTVDSPAVFRFLDEVRADNRWVFPFSRTEEILDTLRTQLSTRFQDLLTLYREGRLRIPPEFFNEPENITQIVTDRIDYWEFRLASELLRDRIERLTTRFADLENGFAVRRAKFIRAKDTLQFVQDLLHDFSLLIESAGKVLSDQLTPAFGEPGIPGDAVKIRSACDNLYSLFLSLYEWQLDVRFARVHDVFSELFPLMNGWTTQLLKEFARIPNELDQLLTKSDLDGSHEINLKIDPPETLHELSERIHKMSQDPIVLKAIISS
jgi:Domain of unknown function (DUF4062)